jgi:hypothetical protein
MPFDEIFFWPPPFLWRTTDQLGTDEASPNRCGSHNQGGTPLNRRVVPPKREIPKSSLFKMAVVAPPSAYGQRKRKARKGGKYDQSSMHMIESNATPRLTQRDSVKRGVRVAQPEYGFLQDALRTCQPLYPASHGH